MTMAATASIASSSSVRPVLSHPSAPSLWAATAPAAPPTPPLATALTTTDVLVIGAGYTGLSAALHLAESGASVCVLDAHAPGWGASGRNGGQVNPTLKYDPDELQRIHGAALGERLIDAVSRSADLVYGLIERHDIDCAPVRAGWLQVGYTQQAVDGMHARARQWERRGVRVELLDRTATAARTGTPAFAGGWLDGRAGAIQPLAYVRGLVRAAQTLGAQVHSGSPVLALERQGTDHWAATTAQGQRIQARQVLLATNGYTDGLWPGLAWRARYWQPTASSWPHSPWARRARTSCPGARQARPRSACCCTFARTHKAVCSWAGADILRTRRVQATMPTWNAPWR